MVGNGLVSHSNVNHAHRSLTVILTEPWHRRSCENSIFQNDKWPQVIKMPNSIIANSIMGRKINFVDFFRNGTGC
jgi:hypothetical protein